MNEPRDPLEEAKERARTLFAAKGTVYCPYFAEPVALNSDGLHHLRFSARRERTHDEQLLKLRLVPWALDVIRKSATIQEQRSGFVAVSTSKRDRAATVKKASYWGLVAIVGQKKPIKIRVVLRRMGDGKLIFWSVMPCGKLGNNSRGTSSLAPADIEDA